jgi:hypothetical protein
MEGACVAWGLDNNLTRKVSLADTLLIVELKGLIAGPVNLLLGLWAGGGLPGAAGLVLAGMTGFLGIGVSLALFVVALRHLGTARTGAYFATAPFLGRLAAVLVLSEPLTPQLILAGALMAFGVWLHLTEDHDHEHEHAMMKHIHPHSHDEHHQHTLSEGSGRRAAYAPPRAWGHAAQAPAHARHAPCPQTLKLSHQSPNRDTKPSKCFSWNSLSATVADEFASRTMFRLFPALQAWNLSGGPHQAS